ncbi:Pyridoxal-5'-phosphate-dependent_protein [Hexamita inflata]|uniref:Pyridoxal-5'-phosphate-dependent protein n=1 Tax=Hexamita inflata TaxID=28002 RepID=A0AA86QVQ5_9EUKA|nr:Pyridoxal-5'-phosphate-dependent protein [Hexamita inflata]
MSHQEVIDRTIKRCHDKQIILPTIAQQIDPTLIPQQIRDELIKIDPQEVNSLNLFRITWHNDPKGGFRAVPNYVVVPPELSGCKSNVLVMLGKYFPTGAHKVGATYVMLSDMLTKGTFDPEKQQGMFPSTGNFCRGGAFNACLLGCQNVAVLPENMSEERFAWLRRHNAEIHATPGCESNVKEVFDKAKQLCAERGDKIVNFNQFELLQNYTWHYNCTGRALEKVFLDFAQGQKRLFGSFFTTGSAGSIAAADYLKFANPNKKSHANVKEVQLHTPVNCCGEAVQCPTIFSNGYGAHQIEGIGDKHIPWIFNTHSQDMVACIDDAVAMRVLRLFNEPFGKALIQKKLGWTAEQVEALNGMGISGVANMIGCIKMAKYYDGDANDVFVTVATDSCAMYMSRLVELEHQFGKYTELQAELDWECLKNVKTDYMRELSYAGRKQVHHLKYFTWVEQQGKTVEDLDAQFYERGYWEKLANYVYELDQRIVEFNTKAGVLKAKYNIQ